MDYNCDPCWILFGAGPSQETNAEMEDEIICIYVSMCSASIPIPHVQTVLTKHIKVATLVHKMWQFNNCFLQSYMLLIFLFT